MILGTILRMLQYLGLLLGYKNRNETGEGIAKTTRIEDIQYQILCINNCKSSGQLLVWLQCASVKYKKISQLLKIIFQNTSRTVKLTSILKSQSVKIFEGILIKSNELYKGNYVKLLLRIVFKHLKCTPYREAVQTGSFINKCRAKKTHWATIGICGTDFSPRTLSLSK